MGTRQKYFLTNFSGSSLPRFLARTWLEKMDPLVFIVEDAKQATQVSDDLSFFVPQARVDVFPAFDVLPYCGLSPQRSVMHTHLRILARLIHKECDFLVIPKEAFLRRTIPRRIFEDMTLKLVLGDLIERDDLIRQLTVMGYERSSVVEDAGQFAVRGDVVDIFSPYHELPVRVSFFDIEVESMRWFESTTQRTAEMVGTILVVPAHEIFLEKINNHPLPPSGHPPPSKGEGDDNNNRNWQSDLKKCCDRCNFTKDKRDQVEERIANKIYFHGIEFFLPFFYPKLSTIFDFLGPRTTLVCDLTNPLAQSTQTLLAELAGHRQQSQHIENIFSPEDLFLTSDEVEQGVQQYKFLTTDILTGPDQEILLRQTADQDDKQNISSTQQVISGGCESNAFLTQQISTQVAQIHTLAPLASELNHKRQQGFSCFVVCRNDMVVNDVARSDYLADVIGSLPPRHTPTRASPTLPPQGGGERLIVLLTGALHEGFLCTQDHQWWLTDEEIFGRKTKRAVSVRLKTAVFSSFSEIEVGDYLIHMDHGIGLYQGLTKLAYDVNKNDFLAIEYLGGDKLYVPVDRLNRVQRFAAQEGITPQLDKLGGTTWLKTRAKAKRAARKLAAELLDLEAKRAALKGMAFEEQTNLMEEFEAGFEFEETPDQWSSIHDVVKDMTRERPMDRVICGDVGYGKTEVALRAAFLAVANHRQVAVLVPTTILAYQHFSTFVARFKNYAVNVELLSRFRSEQEQRDVVKRLREGQVDVVIGTHRLLSQDIHFYQLGLLVVDEEHKFGVIHKERIKKLEHLVDVLTLTATPIPRTLNFALNGIRDLSIINTPPEDRLAVHTHACYFDEDTIRDAILKELRREGQIFFVHNRVQSIEKMATQVAKIVPDARVRFAHGQMDEVALEDIMLAFMRRDFDVLVTTTIIESGLDIPNANTMIINRADTLGLAQLYQLRGRVGRSSRQAYCYLILPTETLMTPKAKQRVAVLQRFSELGSGFKVASHDLEIRGAGNILGDEQSGHIAAIGYDLYVQLLQQAIAELKNQNIPEDFEPEIQLQVSAKIPDDFIPDEKLRLVLYRQMSSCETFEEVDELLNEWSDRFGKIPEPMQNLSGIIKIRILCKQLLVSALRQSGEQVLISFHPEHQIDTQALVALVQKKPRLFSLTKDGRFSAHLNSKTGQDILKEILGVLQGLPVVA